MTEYKLFTVDSFASERFRGNPAGVVLAPSAQPIADATMQSIASELNLSETAFVTPLESQGDDEFRTAGRFSLRWFTRTVEVKVCGHATLAAARVLIDEVQNQNEVLRFETLSGVLSVRVADNGKLAMTFPADIPEPVAVDDDVRLLVESVVGRYSAEVEVKVSPAVRYMVVHDPTLTSADLASLAPRIAPDALAAGARVDLVGIIVTAAGGGYDFTSRFFAPWCGIPEDPVTGSAHTVLAPFWADKLGKTTFKAKQLSKRGGELDVELAHDGSVVITTTSPDRPTYIGIHARDANTQILYVSSGCRQGVGFTPEYVMRHRATDFIADDYDSSDYARVYETKTSLNPLTQEEEDDDEANAYAMYINIKTASGTPVLTRVTSFKCDNCVIYIGMAFPEVALSQRHELEVQMLDGAMKRKNITRERESHVDARRTQANDPNVRVPLYYAQSKQVKAAFVLETPEVSSHRVGRRLVGPLVAFVTGSVSRLIDADTSDLHQAPFMRLVAPEDLLHVGRFFDRLTATTDVLFETFSLLSRPPVVEGDVAVGENENTRVVVECLGTAVQDGVALLLRKLRTEPPPKRDSMGNYIHSRVHEVSDEAGYISLSELISSDPDSSDVPVAWAQLR
ncbi:hypothetical protein IWQ56_001230 [Coemansia nantahalensis]|nr:hypothetical protein IWQ56_001230 [Coemansia nantahalensis]